MSKQLTKVISLMNEGNKSDLQLVENINIQKKKYWPNAFILNQKTKIA